MDAIRPKVTDLLFALAADKKTVRLTALCEDSPPIEIVLPARLAHTFAEQVQNVVRELPTDPTRTPDNRQVH